jgi:hypothetical protein
LIKEDFVAANGNDGMEFRIAAGFEPQYSINLETEDYESMVDRMKVTNQYLHEDLKNFKSNLEDWIQPESRTGCPGMDK